MYIFLGSERNIAAEKIHIFRNVLIVLVIKKKARDSYRQSLKMKNKAMISKMQGTRFYGQSTTLPSPRLTSLKNGYL